MRARPRKISQILGHSSPLKQIRAQAHLHASLLNEVQSLLPHSAQAHITAVVQQRASLVVFTDSPVWNSKLRFHTPRLLRELRHKHPGLANIEIRNQLARRTISKAKKQPARKLSESAAQTVKTGAETVENPALRSALQKLAKALRPK